MIICKPFSIIFLILIINIFISCANLQNAQINDTYTQVDIDCEGTGRISCISETYEENWDSEIVYK